MMYCSKCGSAMRGSTTYCPACGYSVKQMKLDAASAPPKFRPMEPAKRSYNMISSSANRDGDEIRPGYGSDGLRTRRIEPEEKPKGIIFGRPKKDEEEKE
ncbi:MAG: hypothetical protein MUC62_03305 [Candidatus Thermoplasmatota archaeon]|nr:hypothetical protein [Candidatus Thermoplasmatota archaeon]